MFGLNHVSILEWSPRIKMWTFVHFQYMAVNLVLFSNFT